MHRTMATSRRCVVALPRHRAVNIGLARDALTGLGGRLRTLLAMTTLLALTACNSPHPPPQGTALQDVRAIEIRYSYLGWERAEEVHRLRPGEGRRTFVRRSQLDGDHNGPVTTDSVPAQRVGELLWALSAPAWTRERAVEEVARRVRPRDVLRDAATSASTRVPACTTRQIQDHMHRLLGGARLRELLEDYYTGGSWTDDSPVMHVVIEYGNAPPQVLSSRSQKLMMLPWTEGEPSAGQGAASQTWSVPVSQALGRLLPEASKAATRLNAREDIGLKGYVSSQALKTCEAQYR
jgi:hypothetical protein